MRFSPRAGERPRCGAPTVFGPQTAWAGQAPELDERMVPPPQGQLSDRGYVSFNAWPRPSRHPYATRGRQALELADSADTHGHYATAHYAVHLAERIQATQNLAERATGLAGRVDGDVAGGVQDHLAALLAIDGAGLEKIAVTFESLGHLAFADEAFSNAADAHRLRSAGVTPTFAARRTEGTESSAVWSDDQTDKDRSTCWAIVQYSCR